MTCARRCSTHPVLCDGRRCPDFMGNAYISSKHTRNHGKSREIYEPSVYTGAARKDGKVEREVRGILVGGLYSDVGGDRRIRIPDVSSTRQRKVLDMKHDLDGINSLPGAAE